MRRRVAIGFIGTKLDSGRKESRWAKWRPTIAMCQHSDAGMHFDRVELIADNHGRSLAEGIAEDIGVVSPATEVRVHPLNIGDPWDFGEVYTSVRDFIDTLVLDVEQEDYFVNITTGTHVEQIVWFLLCEAKFLPAKLLQLSPAGGVAGDPKGRFAVIDLDLSRYDAIATRFAADRASATSFLKSGIKTRNATFNAMIEEIEKVAIRSRAPVLLTGPTGAGKSQLAKKVWELKKAQRQVTGEFVEVNCATLRGDQAMSTLFGHVRGAFTGAVGARPGLMKMADKGVLFLDEIGELGLDEQAMCLRALEERRFLPMGGDKDVYSEFQLIAGTNQDLQLAVREGRFREDLLARLDLWSFQIPALIERREDIEPNVDFELARFAHKEGRKARFNSEARALYLAFATGPEALWSANFRDLTASVARMATLAPEGRINEDTVRAELARLKRRWSGSATSDLVDLVLGDRAIELDLFDRVQLAKVLEVCRSSASLSAAGRELFAASRQTRTTTNDADRLRKYLARFDLTFENTRAA